MHSLAAHPPRRPASQAPALAASPGLDRRTFLKLSGLSCLAAAGLKAAAPAAAPGDFRFAFLTDIHVQPEKAAGDGFKQCLRAVHALAPKPDFMITGGDHVMDSLLAPRERIKVQWDLFHECWKQVELPAYHAVGNHDVGGWAEGSLVRPEDAEYGKRYFADRFGQGKTYRSFNHKGWHFVILDSIAHDPGTPRGFLGWIDDAQQAWLKEDLRQTPRGTPIVIVTHVPMFSVWSQMIADPRQGTNKQSLVNNAHVVRKLFAGHNVRLVLSGHGHLVERIELGGITYIQGGAVCGNWWRGPLQGRGEGFGEIVCRGDGSFDYAYHTYGWKAVA